ncbi:MAG: hypothetical protein ABIJ42_09575, partial [Acidobacteriota bacterium]
FTSSCSPPRITATRLLSVTDLATSVGLDFHQLAQCARRRTGMSFQLQVHKDGMDLEDGMDCMDERRATHNLEPSILNGCGSCRKSAQDPAGGTAYPWVYLRLQLIACSP